jgi:hypothetical protein
MSDKGYQILEPRVGCGMRFTTVGTISVSTLEFREVIIANNTPQDAPR